MKVMFYYVVKLTNLKEKYQWKDSCKIRYFIVLHYFTLPNCSVNLFHNNCAWHSIKSMHTYIKLQGTHVAVYVNKHLSN